MPTRNLAIMFTDIKGFTARTSESTRSETMSLLAKHDKLLRPVFGHFDGNVVKTIGDAFLVTFDSPTDAVVCGLTIQEVLKKHNERSAEEDRIQVRVAISVGDVELRDNEEGKPDIFGEPVNLASRLEGLADAGEVFFTEAVYLTMNRKEVPTAVVGEHTFKGIPTPVRVYKVVMDPKSDQIRAFSERVRLEHGRAVIEGPTRERLRAPESTAWKAWVAVGATASVLLLASTIGWPRFEDARSARQARNLIAQGENLTALQVLSARLKKSPDDLKLRALASEAASAHLAYLEKERGDEGTLEWVVATLDDKPYLKSLRDKQPVLETKITVRKAMKAHDEPILAAWDMTRKFPGDKEVPIIAAQLLEPEFGSLVAVALYQRALELGATPTPAIWESCQEIFRTYAPDHRYGEGAHAVAKGWYKTDRKAWAEKIFTGSAKDLELLSALAILKDEGDSRVSAPFWVAVLTLTTGEVSDSVRERILAEKDSGLRAQAVQMLESAVSKTVVPYPKRAAVNEVIAEMKKF